MLLWERAYQARVLHKCAGAKKIHLILYESVKVLQTSSQRGIFAYYRKRLQLRPVSHLLKTGERTYIRTFLLKSCFSLVSGGLQ